MQWEKLDIIFFEKGNYPSANIKKEILDKMVQSVFFLGEIFLHKAMTLVTNHLYCFFNCKVIILLKIKVMF